MQNTVYPPPPYAPAAQPMSPCYPPHTGGPPATVFVQQTPVASMRFGELPVSMTCCYCGVNIVTGTSRANGTMVWLAAGAICLAGCFLAGMTWFGCCLIPFCIPSLQDTEHYCPNCRRLVGRHNRML